MYMMFLGPYEEGGDFRDEGIAGIRRFLDGVWRLVRELDAAAQAPDALRRATHRAIKKVSEDLEHLRYNTAIAALMTLLNDIRRLGPAGSLGRRDAARSCSRRSRRTSPRSCGKRSGTRRPSSRRAGRASIRR